MKVKSDDTELELTPEYIEAIKNLMIQCILMMRKVDPKYANAWYYGICKIDDFMASNGHKFTYGSIDDFPLFEELGIYVEVPF